MTLIESATDSLKHYHHFKQEKLNKIIAENKTESDILLAMVRYESKLLILDRLEMATKCGGPSYDEEFKKIEAELDTDGTLRATQELPKETSSEKGKGGGND